MSPELGVLARLEQSLLDLRDLPGLEAWYDAQYPNGFRSSLPTENSVLAQWNDLSGKGRHLVQSTLANRPRWVAARNLFVPKSWTLPTGATVDANGVYNLGTAGGLSTVIPGDVRTLWIYVGGNSTTVVITTEWFSTVQSPNVPLQPNGGRYIGASYFAADKTTPVANTNGNTANGHAIGFPLNTWSKTNAVFQTGPGIHWIAVGIGQVAYNSAGSQVRNVDIYINATSNRGYVTPANAGPVVQFDAVDDWMSTAAAVTVGTGTGPVTLYVVGAMSGPNNAASTNQRFVSVSADGTNPGVTHRAALFPGAGSLYMYADTSGISRSAPYPSIPYVGSGVNDGTAGAAVAVNGSTLNKALTGMGPSGVAQKFFVSATAAAQALNGHIQAAAIFSRQHDEATRRRVELYLAAKYSLTLTRP